MGLVGCGRVAERGYLPALRAAGASLVAVADRDPERPARLAPGVPWFTTVDELLGAVPVDLLVVATPGDDHVQAAELAARSGVQALVEKPPAPTADGAAALARLEPSPWIGFNRRFEPRLRSLRAATLAHGRPVELSVLLTIDSGAWGAYVSSDGPLLDLGSHAVDLALWLTGAEVERVRVTASHGDAVAFELDLGDSTVGITVAHDRSWRERIVVRDGGRRVGGFDAGGTLGRIAARIGRGRSSTLPELLALQLRAAKAALAAPPRDPSLATAHDGWRTMRVLDAVGQARSAPGQWCPLAAGSVG